MIFDSWGSSWASAWGQSWVHTRAPVIIDTHDGVDERLNEYIRRKEELHESILRAFESVTGVSEIPTIETVEKVQAKTKAERIELKNLKEEIIEYGEINKELLKISQILQEREMNDIAFILGVL